MVPLKLSRLLRKIVETPEAPRWRVSEPGLEKMLKSGPVTWIDT